MGAMKIIARRAGGRLGHFSEFESAARLRTFKRPDSSSFYYYYALHVCACAAGIFNKTRAVCTSPIRPAEIALVDFSVRSRFHSKANFLSF